MRSELIQRRDQAMKRLYAAEDADPSRASALFRHTVREGLAELEQLALLADRPDADPAEIAKTFRLLGDVYFMASFEDASALDQSLQFYARAEQLLPRATEVVEGAKLDLNYANTLRKRSEGTDLRLLAAAEVRYENARDAFRRAHLGQHAAAVEAQLVTLRTQLSLVRGRNRLATGIQALKGLAERAETTPAETHEDLRAELERWKARAGGGLPEMIREAMGQLEALVAQHPEVAEPHEAILGRLRERAKDIGGQSSPFRPEMALLAALRERYEQDRVAGRVSASRQPVIERVLDELEQIVAEDDGSVAFLARGGPLLRRLAMEIADLPPEVPIGEGARDQRVGILLEHLKRTLQAETLQSNVSSDARAVLVGLALRLGVLTAGGRAPQQDEPQARQVAMEARAALLRDNLMLVSPLWTLRPVQPNPRRVFCVVGSRAAGVLEPLCEARGIEPTFSSALSGELASAHWHALRQSAFAVFDLTAGSHQDLACYDLGIALVLGLPLVVLAEAGVKVPFDIDVRPTILDDPDEVGAALDAAAFGYPRLGGPSTVAATITEARRRYPMHPGTALFFHELARAAGNEIDPPCPIRASVHLERLLGWSAPPRAVIVHTTWPGAYPEPGGRRCFHVMPFKPAWSDEAKRVAKQVCDAMGIQYRRHDDVKDPHIIHSLWDELCLATDVLVDLSIDETREPHGINLNVIIELGIVHTLGRRVHLVGRPGTIEAVKERLPTIATTRIGIYGEVEALGPILEGLFSEGAHAGGG